LFGAVTFAVCAIAALLFRYGMREQFREDMREARGITSSSSSGASYDPYVRSVRDHASELCACADLACGRAAKVRFENWARELDRIPTDADVLDAAAVETDRMAACFARLDR
jgi:hypothetical protein